MVCIRRGGAARAAGMVLSVFAIGILSWPMAAMAQSAEPAGAPVQDPARAADLAEAARLEAEAIALRDAGDFLGAEHRVGDLIPIELRLYGPQSALVANSHGFRAAMARQRGDFAAEVAHLRLELAVRDQVEGEGERVDTAFRLVQALTSAGDLVLAEEALMRVWGGYVAQFSPTLPLAQETVEPLVTALNTRGDRAGAERLLAALDAPLTAFPERRERWLRINAEALMKGEHYGLVATLLRRAAESRRDRGATAADQAETWSQLANALGQAVDWAGAAEARRLALAQWRPRGVDAARESAYLGRALLEIGENAEAYERLKRAGADFRGRDFDDEDRAYAAIHLARAALATDQDAEAELLSRQALAARRATAEANPSALRLALEVRADVMAARNQFAEAETLLAEARALALAYDPSGAAAAYLDASLSNLRGVQGRRQDAEALARKAVEETSARHGPDSPQMVVVLGNLATALSNSGENARAIPLIEQAVAIQRRVAGDATTGPAVRDLLAIEFKMGRIYGSAGRDGEAMDILSSVHERAQVLLGRTDAVTIDSGVQTGLLLIRAGRQEEAEVMLGRMVLLAEQAHGADSVDLVEVLQLHAYALHGLGRYPAALSAIQRAMALLDGAAPRWPNSRIDVKTNTAYVLMEMDRTSEALTLLREAGGLALERNARHAREGGGETGVVRTPFQALVRAAWLGAEAG